MKKTKISRKMKVVAEAEKILGLANMLYVQNFVEEAIEKCHECITVAPHDASPYHTLGLIYEEKGDMAKAMDFYSIAAHVSKTDVALWLRIADMALTLENRRHAAYCKQSGKRVRRDFRRRGKEFVEVKLRGFI